MRKINKIHTADNQDKQLLAIKIKIVCLKHRKLFELAYRVSFVNGFLLGFFQWGYPAGGYSLGFFVLFSMGLPCRRLHAWRFNGLLAWLFSMVWASCLAFFRRLHAWRFNGLLAWLLSMVLHSSWLTVSVSLTRLNIFRDG